LGLIGFVYPEPKGREGVEPISKAKNAALRSTEKVRVVKVGETAGTAVFYSFLVPAIYIPVSPKWLVIMFNNTCR